MADILLVNTRQPFEFSRYSASLLVSIEKTNYSVLVLGFSVGDIEIGGVFACFRCGCLALCTNPTSDLLGQVIFLESGLTSEALELLVGFITYLEPALWLENTIGKIYALTNANPGCF